MDETVAKINKIIARLLGKKNNKNKSKLPDKIDNEFVNMVIICLCFLLVWSLTGLYYVEDGYTAIVENFGNKKKVVGGSFGFAVPFPFTKIEKIYTNPIEHIPLGSDDQSSYQLINKNFEHITVDGDFTYLVRSPLLLSNSLFVNREKLNNLIRMSIQSELLKYPGYDFNNINFGIVATTIKIKVNQLISVYGLELILLNIKDVKIKQNIVNQTIDESKLINSSNFRGVEREVSR